MRGDRGGHRWVSGLGALAGEVPLRAIQVVHLCLRGDQAEIVDEHARHSQPTLLCRCTCGIGLGRALMSGRPRGVEDRGRPEAAVHPPLTTSTTPARPGHITVIAWLTSRQFLQI